MPLYRDLAINLFYWDFQIGKKWFGEILVGKNILKFKNAQIYQFPTFLKTLATNIKTYTLHNYQKTPKIQHHPDPEAKSTFKNQLNGGYRSLSTQPSTLRDPRPPTRDRAIRGRWRGIIIWEANKIGMSKAFSSWNEYKLRLSENRVLSLQQG